MQFIKCNLAPDDDAKLKVICKTSVWDKNDGAAIDMPRGGEEPIYLILSVFF
jgi:hypothetical protein